LNSFFILKLNFHHILASAPQQINASTHQQINPSTIQLFYKSSVRYVKQKYTYKYKF